MSWLPKSPKARRRLTLVAAIAPVLALAVGLTLWKACEDLDLLFYTPSQAARRPETCRPACSVQLGGLVPVGSDRPGTRTRPRRLRGGGPHWPEDKVG